MFVMFAYKQVVFSEALIKVKANKVTFFSNFQISQLRLFDVRHNYTKTWTRVVNVCVEVHLHCSIWDGPHERPWIFVALFQKKTKHTLPQCVNVH